VVQVNSDLNIGSSGMNYGIYLNGKDLNLYAKFK